MKVCVIGGMNTDIIGTPERPLLVRDSNIGRLAVKPGGVGRNIAENLVRMGFEVELIAPLGEDPLSALLRLECERAGIGLTGAVTVPGGSCGAYLCLNDHLGDMYIALNDMHITDALTPGRIDMDIVDSSDACVLDANISRETIAYVAENTHVPLMADPVSCAKCERLLPALPRLALIKPNLMEAQLLTGRDVPLDCARALVDMGVQRAFVSLGEGGMAYADSENADILHNLPVAPVNTTGAGDSATAALTAAFLTGRDARASAELACKAAALTLMSEGAVSPLLTPDILY